MKFVNNRLPLCPESVVVPKHITDSDASWVRGPTTSHFVLFCTIPSSPPPLTLVCSPADGMSWLQASFCGRSQQRLYLCALLQGGCLWYAGSPLLSFHITCAGNSYFSSTHTKIHIFFLSSHTPLTLSNLTLLHFMTNSPLSSYVIHTYLLVNVLPVTLKCVLCVPAVKSNDIQTYLSLFFALLFSSSIKIFSVAQILIAATRAYCTPPRRLRSVWISWFTCNTAHVPLLSHTVAHCSRSQSLYHRSLYHCFTICTGIVSRTRFIFPAYTMNSRDDSGC